MKVTVIPILTGALGTVIKGTGSLRNRRTSEDHPNYNIIKIGQNAGKSPGDLRRLAVTQDSSEKPSANVGAKEIKFYIHFMEKNILKVLNLYIQKKIDKSALFSKKFS